MPKNEDGEFELILGNRQLLSVFFIVVVLLGVFFTMGYIVGRNTTPVSEASNTHKEGTPVVESVRPTEVPAPVASSAPVETAPQRAAETTEAPAKAAPRPESTPEVKKSEQTRAEAKAEAKEEAKAEAKKEKAAKARTPGVHSDPITGQTYLQLAATTKHEADIMVDVLRNKGFKSIAAEIDEKPGTYRVLVGPLTDGGANKMRADLQASGFPGNAAIRRTF